MDNSKNEGEERGIAENNQGMKIKEAIEYCKETMDDQIEEFGYRDIAIEGIISLLKRGEKYEAMWQTLLEDLDFMPNKEKLLMNWEDFNGSMIKIQQKYFPKEIINE